MGDEPTRVVEIWRLPDGLTFDAVADELRELGYSPGRTRRTVFKPAAIDVALILLAVVETMGKATADALASSVAPTASAFAECWVGTARRECLDYILLFGSATRAAHPPRVCRALQRARPHLGLDLEPPEPRFDSGKAIHREVRRRDVLGGPIHEYERAAA